MDYLFGRNALNDSCVAGWGEKSGQNGTAESSPTSLIRFAEPVGGLVGRRARTSSPAQHRRCPPGTGPVGSRLEDGGHQRLVVHRQHPGSGASWRWGAARRVPTGFFCDPPATTSGDRQAGLGDEPGESGLPGAGAVAVGAARVGGDQQPAGRRVGGRIEHRLFSHITMNWRGRPLTSHEVIVESSGPDRDITQTLGAQEAPSGQGDQIGPLARRSSDGRAAGYRRPAGADPVCGAPRLSRSSRRCTTCRPGRGARPARSRTARGVRCSRRSGRGT